MHTSAPETPYGMGIYGQVIALTQRAWHDGSPYASALVLLYPGEETGKQ